MFDRGKKAFAARILVGMVLITFSLTGTRVLGEDDSADVTATSHTSASSKPTKPFTASYYGVYTGPALTAPLKAGSVNSTTLNYDDKSPQNLTNQFKLDYNFSPDVFVGAVANFLISPYQGAAFLAKDSGVRIGDRHIIHTNKFNFAEDFRVLAPLTAGNQAVGEVLNLQTLQVATYQLNKKVSFGLLAFHTYQAYGAGIPTRDPNNPKDPKDINLYFAPNFTYQFTPTLGFLVYYEFYPWHKVGAAWSDWHGDPTDIAPGISWDITPTVNVTPQLVFYPSRLNLDTIASVVYLSAKLM